MPATPTDRDALARSCLPLAYKLAKSFARTTRDADRDDYESAAMLGLALAARDFDPTRGHKFITVAHRYIANELKSLNRLVRRRQGLTVHAATPFTDYGAADGDPFDPMDPASDPTAIEARRDDAEVAALAELFAARLLALTPEPPGGYPTVRHRPYTRGTPRHHELVATCRAALDRADPA